MSIEQLVSKFNLKGDIVKIEENHSGNINKTYVVTINNNGVESKYVLQRINTTVFNEPYLLMQNIENVTNYYRKYLVSTNGDVSRGTLSVIKTKKGKNLYRTRDDEYFR